MIETVLGLELFCHAMCYGLHDDNGGIEVGAPIHLPYNPIDECTQEVSFAELYDALRALCLCGCCGIEGKHGIRD